jgi:predicted nucleic acid-binding protein
MKYVVDTSLFNKIADGSAGMDELPKDGGFLATHVQIDELNRTKDEERRAKLFLIFAKTINDVVPTESFILGTSRVDEAKLGDGAPYAAIKKMLDSLNGGKQNNSEDALIAEVALKNGYVLLTADRDLYEVAQRLNIGVMYWAVWRPNDRLNPTP